MKTFKTRTIAAVVGAVLLCSAGAGAYYAKGYVTERHEREAQSQFAGLLGQPLQLQWAASDRSAAASTSRVAGLLQSRAYDTAPELAAVIAEQLAHSPIERRPAGHRSG